MIYQGEPQFQDIDPGTQLQRAVNTDKEIIKVGDMYYMCYQGVWFMASTAEGAMDHRQLRSGGDLRNPCKLSGAQRNLRYG